MEDNEVKLEENSGVELDAQEQDESGAAEQEAGEESIPEQENRKALPRFLLIMAGSLLGGVLLGVALVLLDGANLSGLLEEIGWLFTTQAAGWLLIALPVVELVVCLPIYSGAKRKLEKWDGEDEKAGNEIEAKLSVCIWITGMAMILDMFLLAAMVSGFAGPSERPWNLGPGMFFGGLGAFFVSLLVGVLLQQKLVDATKRLYPEKRGSVYDTGFQKKWYESCDEAERAIIGQCAYRAYQAMSRTCLVLWVVFTLGGMYLDWGFLPALAVCVVWGVGQSAYSYSCIRLSKPGEEKPNEE